MSIYPDRKLSKVGALAIVNGELCTIEMVEYPNILFRAANRTYELSWDIEALAFFDEYDREYVVTSND